MSSCMQGDATIDYAGAAASADAGRLGSWIVEGQHHSITGVGRALLQWHPGAMSTSTGFMASRTQIGALE